MAAILARAGVDIISVWNYGSFRWLIPPYGTPPAVNAEFTRRLKQILNIPALLGHRIGDPIIAEQLLE
jgi:hypothetical protein